jgi:hypothetical protein
VADVQFSKPRQVVDVNGNRIGLVTCLTCGAAVMLEPGRAQDVRNLHAALHAGQLSAPTQEA